jgi:hypothetical protein
MQLDQLPIHQDFDEALTSEGLWPLQPTSIDTLQINVGWKALQPNVPPLPRRCGSGSHRGHVARDG